MTHKKREISIEYEEILMVRRPDGPDLMWCATCAERVTMLAAHQAARIAGVSERALFRSVEAGSLHFAETQEGSLLICCNSLGAAAADNMIAHAVRVPVTGEAAYPAVDIEASQVPDGEL